MASANPTFYADFTNPQSLNKYAYCYNNPLRYLDPDGHAPDPRDSLRFWMLSPVIAWEGAKQLARDAVVGFGKAWYNDKIGERFTLTQNESFGAEAVQLGLGFALPKIGGRIELTGTKSGATVSNWEGFPEGVPRPEGAVFRLVEGAEYTASRQAGNRENAAIRREDPALYADKHIHEIQPIKLGGNAIARENKVALAPAVHYQVTAWFQKVVRYLKEQQSEQK